MEKEKKSKQYSIRFNSNLDKQLTELSKLKNQTKAKLIKRLVNDAYINYLQKNVT